MDPYNQYPTYPFTVSDETGYYSPGGDHHEEPYSPEPQEYSYTAQHDLEPGQRAGATVDDTLKGAESLQPPDASPLPQITEQLDIYETNLEKSGENLSYYAPELGGRHSRSPSPMPDPGDENHPSIAGDKRRVGGTLVGSATGYYLGHKKHHGLLGAVGGALLGNYVGDKVMERREDRVEGVDVNEDEDYCRHCHHHHHHHHRHHHHHHHGGGGHHHHHHHRHHHGHGGHDHHHHHHGHGHLEDEDSSFSVSSW